MNTIPTKCKVCGCEVRHVDVIRGDVWSGRVEVGWKCTNVQCGLSITVLPADYSEAAARRLDQINRSGHIWKLMQGQR